MTIISEHSPVTYQDKLPDSCDVVIIGAGVIGISTAWFLVNNGISVTVCDKGRVAGEQSSRNWGWVRQQGRDYAELPIMIDSINIWDSLAAQTGEDLGFTRQGVAYLAQTEQEMAEFDSWMEIAGQHQLDTCLLGSAEVDNLITDNPGQWLGAMYTKSDGRAEPFKAVPALARASHKKGCHIRENCAVRTIGKTGGRVSEVFTECGQIKTQAVLCAGGAWTSAFTRNLGIDIPQLTVRSTVARTSDAPEFFKGNATSSDIAFRRREDGGYTLALPDYHEHYVGMNSLRYMMEFLPNLCNFRKEIRLRFGNGLFDRLMEPGRWDAESITPFEKNRVLNPAPSKWAVEQMKERIIKRFPSLKGIKIQESWAGMIDVTPDIVPVMDQVDDHAGLFIATGFSGHGFGLGPGAGQVMADLVQGKKPVHDLKRFRLSRFSDGSKLQPGPAL